MKFKASQIGKLMTLPKSKSEKLSEGAKTEILALAKQYYFGYKTDLNDRKVKKGLLQEQDSIDLVNVVRIEDYQKNHIRLDNDYLSGCCDIITDNSIIDVKTSWDLESFPATIKEAEKKSNAKLYEWQGRAYMMLYDKPKFELIYCMVDTDPDHELELLNPWDDLSTHRVAHIEPRKRITVLTYERDAEIEEFMQSHLAECHKYYLECIEELTNK